MANHIPPHPGILLKSRLMLSDGRVCMAALYGVAKNLNLRTDTLYHIFNGRCPITSNTAIALERNNIGTAKEWLALQADHDIQKLLRGKK